MMIVKVSNHSKKISLYGQVTQKYTQSLLCMLYDSLWLLIFFFIFLTVQSQSTQL